MAKRAGRGTEDGQDDAILLLSHDDLWDELTFARAELAQVQKALSRIEAGTYGINQVSGKPIPRERLEAVPTSTTLIDETEGDDDTGR